MQNHKQIVLLGWAIGHFYPIETTAILFFIPLKDYFLRSQNSLKMEISILIGTRYVELPMATSGELLNTIESLKMGAKLPSRQKSTSNRYS